MSSRFLSLVLLLFFTDVTESKSKSKLLEQSSNEINTKHNCVLICQINNFDFWKHINWYFRNATTVNLSLLLHNYPDFVEIYLSNMLGYLCSHHRYKRTYTVKRYRINDTDDSRLIYKQIRFNNNYMNETIDWDEIFRYKSYDEFENVQFMKRYSSDPEDAYFLFAWDIKDLQMFLDAFPKQLLQNPRGFYLFLLISPEVNETVERSVSELLKRLWEEQGVLNTQIKFPCSEEFNVIFRFNPFISVGNGNESESDSESWGILEKFLIDDALQNDKKYTSTLSNLYGYPVKISLFARKPSALQTLPKPLAGNKVYEILNKSNGFGGIDGAVLANIATILNFTVLVITPDNNEEYGYLNKVGVFVGSLGDVVYRHVTASFNARFISFYGTNDIEFTTPTSNDLLCLLVPKSEKIPQWLKIFRCFTTDAWLSIFALYILISICWYFFRHINISLLLTAQSRNEYLDSLFEVLALFVASPFRNVSTDNQRIFVAVCVMFNVVFGGIFQGSLYTSYTKTTYYPDVNSLEMFDKTGMKIGTSSQSFTDIFGDKPNPLMASLKKKVLILNGTSSLHKAAMERETAAFERKQDAPLRIETEYTRQSDGFELLHMVPECPWSYYVSYIVPKGSPYLHIFDVLIMKFRECGLVNKWTTDTVDALILEKRVRSSEENEALKPFTLTDMQAAFLLVSLGLGAALIVFVFEICLHGSQVVCNQATCSFY